MTSYETATSTLKTLLAHPAFSRVDETFDEMADALADHKEIEAAITTGAQTTTDVSEFEESELQAEMEQLVEEKEQEERKMKQMAEEEKRQEEKREKEKREKEQREEQKREAEATENSKSRVEEMQTKSTDAEKTLRAASPPRTELPTEADDEERARKLVPLAES